MTQSPSIQDFCWYAVQTLSNQEGKVKRYLDKFIEVDGMEEEVAEVLVPTETVTEVKNGKKYTKTRKFYPGYIFIKMRLYDENSQINHKVWHFVTGVEGVIGFPGGDRPVPLKQEESDGMLKQVADAQGKEVPKIQYEMGEQVKIVDGPFQSMLGEISEVDPDQGKLKVSVSIFGRFTPVDLEYWQVTKNEE